MNNWTKINGTWVIRTLTPQVPGSTVTVTKRNGETKTVTLGEPVNGPLGAYYYAPAQAPAAPTQQVGDLTRIIAMFARAAQHLKFPAIVLNGIRVNVAGQRARQPGSLTVTTAEKDGTGRRAWLGRVTLDGTFEPGRNTDPAVGDTLRRFACDPVGEAAAYGRLHGACCFCNHSLGHGEDRRSVEIGYGPDCADRYGLPWGSRLPSRSAEAVEADMQRMESAADRQQTARDERAKMIARESMEAQRNWRG